MRAEKVFYVAVLLILFCVAFLPLLVTLLQSLTDGGHITLVHYNELFQSKNQWTLIRNSLLLSATVTSIATAAGIPLGLCLAKTNLAFKKLFIFLFTLPFLVPPYFVAVAWFHILGRQGLLSEILGSRISAVTGDWLFGFMGSVLVLSIVFTPVIMLVTFGFLKTIPSSFEEAGRLCIGWRKILSQITFPLIRPGLLLGVILVFLLTLGEVTVPMFLRYPVFPVQSLTQFAAFYNFSSAAASAVPLALIALVLVLLEKMYLQRNLYLPDQPFELETLSIDLHSSRKWITIAFGCSALLLIVMPLLSIVLRPRTIANYVEAFSTIKDSLWRSILFGLVGASALTVLGFCTGYLIQRKIRFSGTLEMLLLLLFALPGAVIGTSLILFWNRPSTSFVYGTALILLFGLVAQYIVLPTRINALSLAQIPPSMQEAARSSGSSWFTTFLFITAPLAARGLMTSWIVAYLFCLRDTGLAMVLYPPGRDTLPVRIFTLMANSPQELIAASCVIMMTAILIPLLLLSTQLRRSPQS